jgi:quaternary ammonium compound-resistance protein SugE
VGWVYLLLAGIFEIGFTTSMRYMSWPPRAMPVIAFLICSVASFGFLISAIKTVPLGTAYAVWTGIGAAGTAIFGIFYYAEPATMLRVLMLAALICSIVGLKLVSPQ